MTSHTERVIHILDPTHASHIPLFIPRIERGSNVDGNVKILPFKHSQIDRVMDYPNMPDPPPDCLLMHCEAPGSGINDSEETEEYDGGICFPRRSAKISGGYIFLSHKLQAQQQQQEADPRRALQKQGRSGLDSDAVNNQPAKPGKIACLPLQGCTVEFPPGGRRVFREHAHTGARKGYEMKITVKHQEDKMVCYIVLDSLGLRETWSAAIKMRDDTGAKVTILRPGAMAGFGGSRFMSAVNTVQRMNSLSNSMIDACAAMSAPEPEPTSSFTGGSKSRRGLMGASMKKQQAYRGDLVGDGATGNSDLDAAIGQFGVNGFKEDKWVHEFLKKHGVDELPVECEKLDKWQDTIKNGLRGAVLEQYEYFVEASREMSTMGREVAWIRTLVERQQETLMSMRNIDFGAGFEEVDEGGADEDYGYLSEDDDLVDGEGNIMSDASSVESSSSDEQSTPSASRTPMRANLKNRRQQTSRTNTRKTASIPMAPMDEDEPAPSGNNQTPQIEIPSWISDVTEEVSAFIKESRYSDATELILKAKAEVSGILAAHEQPTPPVVTAPTSAASLNTRSTGTTAALTSSSTHSNSGPQKKLGKKQQALLQRTDNQLDALMDRMTKRLAENLRRKNEALKASAKRERADPLSNLAPLVSPVCLNDDAVALHLLVKLGRYQEAATAYAARRSLLLSECLHERPISSPVGMDAVIYAAQLSSSFFSSLAIAVEGFLDLFIDSNTDNSGNDDDTSLNSRSLTLGGGEKRIPAGALSAIVLWCDSELNKFANVFGSSRLLGGLSLSPPGIRRQDNKEGAKVSLAKEREHSIEVAAKCVNQAFAFASENLDSIGLPLTPKLAEAMRPKLKGCEAEVAALLDLRWKALAFEWSMERNVQDIHVPNRPAATPRSLSDDRRV